MVSTPDPRTNPARFDQWLTGRSVPCCARTQVSDLIFPSLDGKTMTKKRMVLEIGMGTDIRGGDPTKAACRALRDALWHNSLSIATALGQPLDAMIVDVHVGVPRPDMVDKAQVLAVLPYGKGTVTVTEGGLEIPNDAGTDCTLIANACVVVSLDIA